MKLAMVMFAALTALTGCTHATKDAESQLSLGLANPASVYCQQQGGKLEIRHESHGQVGYCHLPSGQVVEEWALFRASQQKCLPEQATSLVGKKKPSDAEIQQLTHAEVIRVVRPNQPVTMDYREDRITLVIQPTTQKIIRASCG
jgi:uncharacterized protein